MYTVNMIKHEACIYIYCIYIYIHTYISEMEDIYYIYIYIYIDILYLYIYVHTGMYVKGDVSEFRALKISREKGSVSTVDFL